MTISVYKQMENASVQSVRNYGVGWGEVGLHAVYND